MNNLGDPQNSGIRKLLETVYEQTSWDNPALINAGLQKVSPGIIDRIKGFFNRASPVAVVDLPAGAGGQSAQLPMGPVGRDFAGWPASW